MNTRLAFSAPLLVLAACGAGPVFVDAAQLAQVEAAGARFPQPGLMTAGQLTEAQLDRLVELGVRDFVNLRPPYEPGTGWEEARAAALGVRFVRIPVAGAADVDRQHAEQLAAALRRSAERTTVVYCGSGNRVGALLALKARFLDDRPAAEALALGQAAGLTRLEPVVRERLGL